jgi:hypothetical protein
MSSNFSIFPETIKILHNIWDKKEGSYGEENYR